MTPESPDQLLIERIRKKMVDQRILEQEDIESLMKTIASGNTKAEDWKFQIENSIERRQRNASSDSA